MSLVSRQVSQSMPLDVASERVALVFVSPSASVASSSLSCLGMRCAQRSCRVRVRARVLHHQCADALRGRRRHVLRLGGLLRVAVVRHPRPLRTIANLLSR